MRDSEMPRREDPRSDEELFDTVRSEFEPDDSRRALGILFDRYHVRVLLSCERILGAGPDAEDAMQEIFLGLVEGPRHYEDRSSFGAWLYVLTRNHCLNSLRRRRREIDVDLYEEFLQEASEALDPAEECSKADLGEQIRRACQTQLTPIEQRVVDLRLRWELPVKEINRMLDLQNRSGARTHLSTARTKLRRALAEFAPFRPDHDRGEAGP